MGLDDKKKNDKSEQNPKGKMGEEQQEMKVYIQGAGGTIVTKSILNGTGERTWKRLGGIWGYGQSGICR